MTFDQYKISIEATQTFSPGNVELLIYLLRKFDSENFKITLYIGHESTYRLVKDLRLSSLKILKSSVLMTLVRSLKKRRNVIFFSSYPPLGKHHKSIVYYHSSFFFNPIKILENKNISYKTKFSRVFVHWIIRIFHKNVDVFFCQTEGVKKELLQNFKNINAVCVPFFNDLDLMEANNIQKNIQFDFFYPATADVHKNHFNLFEAILVLGKQKKVSLVVTAARIKLNFIDRINEVNNELGYEAIINIGRVPKQTVIDYYRKVKALVFPSLEESLGLPLIEAASLKLTIIGSDLPYLYDVVENPIVFDPFDPKNIALTMNFFLEGQYENIKQTNKIENQVVQIINYFK